LVMSLAQPDSSARSPSLTLIFLGTGGAWGLPELNCDCVVCREMRRKNETRKRTALLLSGNSNLLIDCGPDIASQLATHQIRGLDGVLLTHEHGDHYMGLDELVSYKRTAPNGFFTTIPLYVTSRSWEVIGASFGYLQDMGVIAVHLVEPNQSYRLKNFQIMPFKTNHGSFAAGSVGYVIQTKNRKGKSARIVYTSDFLDLPEHPKELFQPDYLIIQSFWLNEPRVNTPNHMSFQRAMELITLWKPRKKTFLVHIGDGDPIPGDPANRIAKKREPADPLKPPSGGAPYPVPRSQDEWQRTVDQIRADYGIPCPCIVAHDDLRVTIG